MKVNTLVVGAGFAGSVLAQRFASVGKSVLVIDRRDHIGGNSFDEKDSSGVLVHRYGPHIFHTNSPGVISYLSQFTEWQPYEHRVLSSVEGKLYPIPINRTTINLLYNLSLNEDEVREFLHNVREPREQIRTSEDLLLDCVGRDLCDRFFRNYTRKQWGVDLADLSASVAGRIPVRTNDDDRYFTDTFQTMPRHGYGALFKELLRHPKITVDLGAAYEDVRGRISADLTIYTGRIDEYYSFRYGRLPYRSLRFTHEHLANTPQYQPVGTVNYPNDYDFTRITEFKHMTGQECTGTSIVREYPQPMGDPYYPIPTLANQKLYERYKKLADAEPTVRFIGRLAEYRYYNMDQVVATALQFPVQ